MGLGSKFILYKLGFMLSSHALIDLLDSLLVLAEETFRYQV
jgi:hypothetical protein